MNDRDPRTRTFDVITYPHKADSALLAVEKPVALYVNGREVITLLCTPENLDELAVGFCRSEGYIESADDLRDVKVDEQAGAVHVEAGEAAEDLNNKPLRRMVTTGLGKGTMHYHVLEAVQRGGRLIDSDVTFEAEAVIKCMDELSRSNALHSQTRGAHGAALADARAIRLLRDDIGRHNAVDKLAGRCLMDRQDISRWMLLATGRISSEMLIKTVGMGVPVLCSMAVPTSLAVDLARKTGVTLVLSLIHI